MSTIAFVAVCFVVVWAIIIGYFSASLEPLLYRLFYWFEMRSIEIQIDGYNKVLDSTTDMDLYFEVLNSRRASRKELAKVRAKYTGTFPSGKRFIWKDA